MAQTDLAGYLTGWNAPTFTGQPHEDVHMWISGIRYGLKQRRVPRELWVAAAMSFLDEEPHAVLDDMRRTMAEIAEKEGQTGWAWDWDMFTRTLVVIHDQVKKDAKNDAHNIGSDFHRFRKEHPYAAAAAGLGLIAAGGITVGPAILVGTLHLLGFSASGVVGGSIAAGIHSVFGGGYLFAMAQSAAAGGIAVAPVAAQAISAGTVALGAWVGLGRDADDAGVAPCADNPPANAAKNSDDKVEQGRLEDSAGTTAAADACDDDTSSEHTVKPSRGADNAGATSPTHDAEISVEVKQNQGVDNVGTSTAEDHPVSKAEISSEDKQSRGTGAENAGAPSHAQNPPAKDSEMTLGNNQTQDAENARESTAEDPLANKAEILLGDTEQRVADDAGATGTTVEPSANKAEISLGDAQQRVVDDAGAFGTTVKPSTHDAEISLEDKRSS